MRVSPFLALPVLLALAACKPAAAPAVTDTVPPAAATPAAAANDDTAPSETCPDADFAAFLKRFESDVEVQRSATADPLTMESIDAEAMPEPAPVSTQVPLAQVQFPVMAGPAQREAEGLVQSVEQMGATDREVTLAIPDTGAQIRFLFRAESCWTLVRVSDDSI